MIFKRKVRNGRVKVRGTWFYPSKLHMKYDGRCDGHWFYFGTYANEPTFVSLHSSAETVDGEDGPHIVDGKLPWMFWYQKCQK